MIKQTMWQRWGLLLGFACAVAGLAAAVWIYGYRQALDSLAERSAADLALASDRVSTQLQIYQELAVLTADHPVLDGLDTAAGQQEAARRLREVADKTAALDVFYADRSGRVLAFADLGMEAIHEFEVVDFPVTVAVDAHGHTIHRFSEARR